MADLRFRHFDTVVSTNDLIAQAARDGEPEGLVITALSQTSGRGRRGRTWQDEPGRSILMSMLFRPSLELAETPKLGFAVSLGIAQWLESFGMEPQLKWPNDILVSQKKIAGILLEHVYSSGFDAIAAGIGLNVTQQSFSGDLESIATSIYIQTGNTYDIAELRELLAQRIFEKYNYFITAGPEEILESWRNYMWGIGENVEILTENETLAGVIQGVDDNGALVIENDAGQIRSIHAADAIKTIRN